MINLNRFGKNFSPLNSVICKWLPTCLKNMKTEILKKLSVIKSFFHATLKPRKIM